MVVNIGDTVVITVPAAFSYTINPFAQPTSDLQARLQSVGLKVLGIDASALSALGAVVFEGWGDLIVRVQPLVTGFATEQDIAGLVAGAADAVGFRVDYSTTHAQVVATAGTPGSTAYSQNLNAPDAVRRANLTDEILKTLDLSGGGGGGGGGGLGIPNWLIVAGVLLVVGFIIVKE